MRKSVKLGSSFLILTMLLCGCNNVDEKVEQYEQPKQVEIIEQRPSDNVELPSEKALQVLEVSNFAERLTNSNTDEISVSYEINAETKTLILYEDLKGVEELANGVLTYHSLLPKWNELIISFKDTAISFEEVLDKVVEEWTLVMHLGDKETDTWYVTVKEGKVIHDTINELIK